MMKKLLLAFSIAMTGTFTLASMPVSSVQAAFTEHAVSGVKTGEVLNMRSDAGTGNDIVGRIPYNGRGVVPTGEERNVGGSTWAKVYWRGIGGWVNKRYIKPASQATVAVTPSPTAAPQDRTAKPPATSEPTVVLVCSGTNPSWRVDISETHVSVNMGDGPVYQVPVSFRQTSANNSRIAVIAGSEGPNSTQAFMNKVDSCNDGSNTLKLPYAITAVLNNRQVISGCCRVLRQ